MTLQAVLCDPARLSELAALRLLDTPAEEQFDRLTRLACRVLGTPIALVSLVDEHRQFFKSACGLPEPWASRRETPLSYSFCQHVVARAAPLIVSNAPEHPLVCGNTAVTELGVVAYLGLPLTLPNGMTFGSFCVVDVCPRSWTTDDRQTMTELAAAVISEITLHAAQWRIRQLQGSLTHHATLLLAAQRIADLSKLVLSKNEIEPSATWLDETSSSLTEMTEAVQQTLTMEVPEQTLSADMAIDVLREKLTPRQLQVFDLLIRGLQTKEIARHLDLSPRTVEVHRAKILERLQMTSFSQLLKQLLADRRPDTLFAPPN
jgi:DNA-binding CsgD family transcriptional regulator